MLLEIKAEMSKFLLDTTFMRNLSGVFLLAIAFTVGLSELHSQNTLGGNASLISISRSHHTIIVEKN